MTLNDRIKTLTQLAAHLKGPEDEFLTALMKRTAHNNGWLTLQNQQRALHSVAEHFLARAPLLEMLASYPISTNEGSDPGPKKTVALVLAGNIPLVGFHDILCVYLAGHRARIKLSSKDPFVLPYLLKLMGKFDEAANAYFQVVDTLSGFDAVIATGSNNSSRYFESYFGKYPHIIRKNRTGIAVLTGGETTEQLRSLGDDVFAYFGLGCRNVSKIFVPQGYDFTPLLETFHNWKGYQNHTKWKNNFDYNFALLTLNKERFYHNGALIVRECEELFSPIATLFYEHYDSIGALTQVLESLEMQTQLVVARPGLLEINTHDFGQAQSPVLTDFADGVDTLAFLTGL